MEKLLKLLEESKDTAASFRTIAEQLMNNYRLKISSKTYRLVECEFYYHCNDHRDPYAHGHELQKTTFGKWYFHGSGLDISLGKGKEEGMPYGGILLRGIVEVNEEDKMINTAIIGPIKICTELFKQVEDIAFHPFDFGFIDISGEPNRNIDVKVFAVPRIGLKPDREMHSDEKFCNRPYRFISFLSLPHKEIEKVKKYLIEESAATITKGEYLEYVRISKESR